MKKILNPAMAILLFTLLVFAGCEKTDPAIHKPRTNTKPVANAGNNARVRLPNTVVLDGSASTDGEHNIVSYKWVLGSGSSTAIIANPNSAKTEVKFLTKGNYRFDLLVTDSGGRASYDFVNVVVLDTQLLNIKVAKDTIIKLPFNRAVLSVTGDDVEDLDLNWKKINGPNSFVIGSQNSSWTNVSDLVEGVYQFEINATNSMQTTVKDTMAITVLPDNNIYTSENLFENLIWVDNGNIYSVIINSISSIIPVGHPIKVYLKPDPNTDWQIVSPEDQGYSLFFFRYFIINNVLTVYFSYDSLGGDVDFGWHNSSIKIVY